MTTLIGTNPDQIPVNSMLGGMAYQDPDSINVKDFNSSGTANISNLSYSGTMTGGTGVINIGSGQIYKDAGGNVSLGGAGALKLNEGTTAQRPASPQEGMIRKNNTLGVIESYSSGGWVPLQGCFIKRTSFAGDNISVTWTPDPSTRCFIYELYAAGGGGGSCGSTDANSHSAGQPGQHGAMLRGFFPRTISLVGKSYTIYTGGGGSGGSIGSSGGTGQPTSITQVGAPTNSVVINGGAGGAYYVQSPRVNTIIRQATGTSMGSTISGDFVGTMWSMEIPPRHGLLISPEDDYMWVAPYTPRGSVMGRGGIPGFASPSSAAVVGQSGHQGEVIIYEYS